MYQFTINPEGDEIVLQDLKKFIDIVQGKNFETLALFGSYSLGEGCIYDGKPRNDYDLLLVGEDESLREELVNAPVGNVVDVWYLKELPMVCTQQMFTIAYSYKLLAGKELRIPAWKPYQIPFEDAINSLSRRSQSMLLAKYEMGKEVADNRKILEQINKMIIAIGDAILIKRGQFHPRYSVRAQLLNSDEIASLYHNAVQSKITGYPDYSVDQLWQLWFSVRDLLREYCVINRITSEPIELVMQYSDMVKQEDLEKLLKNIGVKDQWL